MPTSKLSYFGALSFTLGGLTSACRGNLPPTEPPRVADEAVPGSNANGAPLLAPLAGLGPAAAGSGGTNVLPIPPPGPGGGGMGGASGSAH